MKKKKSHLKKLALLGIASGIMLATQGQAEVSQNQSESYMASNRSYYGPTGYRRGNYVNSSNGNNTNYGQPTAESSWTPPSHQNQTSGQPPVSSCGGSASCGGQPPVSNCGGSASCGGQPPVSSCKGSASCGGQPPVASCKGSHGAQSQSWEVQGRDIMPPPPVKVGTTFQAPPSHPNQNWSYNQK
ncbi:MAG: hypothetical protein CK425_03555 [Parachlamydia sp.]|nr:MAG: hypothetical protein CK425_03555 [Parachlamydia sp.]